MQDFTLRRISIGLGNRTRRGEVPVGQAEVTCGPWSFDAFVTVDGSVDLPGCLQDGPLRRTIAARVRNEVLGEMADRWERCNAREAEARMILLAPPRGQKS